MQETVVPEYDTSGGGLAEPSDLAATPTDIRARAAMLHAKAGSPDPKLAGKVGLGLLALIVVLVLALGDDEGVSLEVEGWNVLATRWPVPTATTK